MPVYPHVCLQVSVEALELELEAFLSCLIWILGSELRSSDIAVSALSHGTIVLALVTLILTWSCSWSRGEFASKCRHMQVS